MCHLKLFACRIHEENNDGSICLVSANSQKAGEAQRKIMHGAKDHG